MPDSPGVPVQSKLSVSSALQALRAAGADEALLDYALTSGATLRPLLLAQLAGQLGFSIEVTEE